MAIQVRQQDCTRHVRVDDQRLGWQRQRWHRIHGPHFQSTSACRHWCRGDAGRVALQRLLRWAVFVCVTTMGFPCHSLLSFWMGARTRVCVCVCMCVCVCVCACARACVSTGVCGGVGSGNGHTRVFFGGAVCGWIVHTAWPVPRFEVLLATDARDWWE